MNYYIRYCKKCGEAFDIDISNELCPKCRKKKNKDGVEDNDSR